MKPCPPGCRCPRHTGPDVRLTPLWRAYLAAFDAHLAAVARDDHRRAHTTRLLMTVLLDGAHRKD